MIRLQSRYMHDQVSQQRILQGVEIIQRQIVQGVTLNAKSPISSSRDCDYVRTMTVNAYVLGPRRVGWTLKLPLILPVAAAHVYDIRIAMLLPTSTRLIASMFLSSYFSKGRCTSHVPIATLKTNSWDSLRDIHDTAQMTCFRTQLPSPGPSIVQR
jgi:hypothetical protein